MAKKQTLLNVDAVTAMLGDTSEASPMARSKLKKPDDYSGTATEWKKSLKATIVHMVTTGMLVDLGGRRASTSLARRRRSPG